MRIAFTHNLKTSDDEAQAEFDTADTVAAIADALRSLGHDVHPIDVGGSTSRLVARLETLRPDLVFNTAEGDRGRYREAFYPALFEQLGLAYTASGPHVCALTLDKQATKLIADRVGLPTPAWRYYDGDRPWDHSDHGLRYPLIVKPNFEGSSKGVTPRSIVDDYAGLDAIVTEWLDRYPAGVLVEEFVLGRDVTVPWIEGVGVLAPAAYRFGDGPTNPRAIYDYALKNDDSDAVHVELDTGLDASVIETLQALTERFVRAAGLRDLGRVDYRVTASGAVFFIEVNALPSLEPGASIYLAAATKGLRTEADVLAAVVDSAAQRQGVAARVARPIDGLRVGLCHNLRRVDPSTGNDVDAEFDAPTTVAAIGAAIERLGHEVVPIEATPELPRIVGDLDLDLVFNIAEGVRGRTREAQVPALLDLLGIEFTGSDAATLGVAHDKGLAKRVVRAAGLATADWHIVAPGAPVPSELTYPVIAKPNAEGSSKGVTASSVCRDARELAQTLAALHDRYGTPVLVERFLTGREFTVGVLGDVAPRVLPIMEVRFTDPADALPVYSYAHKAIDDSGVAFDVPARIDVGLRAAIEALALGAFEALGCRDVARVDVRLDDAGVPHFIECNPLPGLSPGFSDLCVIAESEGMDHAALVAEILAPAVRRLAAARARGGRA